MPLLMGLKPGILFEHKDISKTAMLTMTGVSIPSMDMHKGKKFFYDSESSLEKRDIVCTEQKGRKRSYIAKYSDNRRIGGNQRIRLEFKWGQKQ